MTTEAGAQLAHGQPSSPIRRVVLIDRCSGIQYGRGNKQFTTYRATLPKVALTSSSSLARYLLSGDRLWAKDVLTHNGHVSFAGHAGISGLFDHVREFESGDTLVLVRNSQAVQFGDHNRQHNTFETRQNNVSISIVEVAANGDIRSAADELLKFPSLGAARRLADLVAARAENVLSADLNREVTRELGRPVINGEPAMVANRTGVQTGGSDEVYRNIEVNVRVNPEPLVSDLLKQARQANRVSRAPGSQEKDPPPARPRRGERTTGQTRSAMTPGRPGAASAEPPAPPARSSPGSIGFTREGPSHGPGGFSR